MPKEKTPCAHKNVHSDVEVLVKTDHEPYRVIAKVNYTKCKDCGVTFRWPMDFIELVPREGGLVPTETEEVSKVKSPPAKKPTKPIKTWD